MLVAVWSSYFSHDIAHGSEDKLGGNIPEDPCTMITPKDPILKVRMFQKETDDLTKPTKNMWLVAMESMWQWRVTLFVQGVEEKHSHIA